ncbi:MAG: hypothetical protein ACI9X0_002505 [Kiritimatiellia bacterium]|jgi:hypothetical protein
MQAQKGFVSPGWRRSHARMDAFHFCGDLRACKGQVSPLGVLRSSFGVLRSAFGGTNEEGTGQERGRDRPECR